LEAWRRGVVLEDSTRTRPAQVRVERLQGKGAWLRVVMHEGHKRQIREIARQLGLPVVKLIRVRIASLHLGSLQPGEWRALTPLEVRALKSGEAPTKKPAPRPAGKKPTRRPVSKKPVRRENKPPWQKGPRNPRGKPAGRGKPRR